MVHLHSKKIDFQWMHLFCVATKYLVLLQLAAVPVQQRDTCIKLKDHQFVCILHGFFSWWLRSRKKIDNSRKLPDLHGKILMSVFPKLPKLLMCYFNTI